MPKFFVTPQDIVGKKITLTGENEKHIKTVLRAEKGKKSPYVTGKERTTSAVSFLWNVVW